MESKKRVPYTPYEDSSSDEEIHDLKRFRGDVDNNDGVIDGPDRSRMPLNYTGPVGCVSNWNRLKPSFSGSVIAKTKQVPCAVIAPFRVLIPPPSVDLTDDTEETEYQQAGEEGVYGEEGDEEDGEEGGEDEGEEGDGEEGEGEEEEAEYYFEHTSSTQVHTDPAAHHGQHYSLGQPMQDVSSQGHSQGHHLADHSGHYGYRYVETYDSEMVRRARHLAALNLPFCPHMTLGHAPMAPGHYSAVAAPQRIEHNTYFSRTGPSTTLSPNHSQPHACIRAPSITGLEDLQHKIVRTYSNLHLHPPRNFE